MKRNDLPLPKNHRDILERFTAACQTDERIIAAFIYGSFAQDKADQYSDLDLFFITTDGAYEDFLTERESFIRLLGEPLFLEDFGLSNGYLIIFSNGTEAEIFFGRESNYRNLCEGPYRVLLDKKGILSGIDLPIRAAEPAKQIEILNQQVNWFWHDLAHFIKAMGRGQLWFAYGELEVIRQICVNLARLRYNFLDAYVDEEPYFKVEQVLPVEQLAPFEKTICPLEYGAMLQAARIIFSFYRTAAPALAQAHGLTYQAGLEQMMMSRLEALDAGNPNTV